MDKEMATVSYFAYEGSQMRLEKIIRKLVITLAVTVVLMFTSNMVWLYVWVTNANPYATHEQMHQDARASNEGIDQERKKQSIIVNCVQRKNADYQSMSRSEIEALIDEWIFSERDRAIIKRRLLDGICLEPLAEEFDLSVSQIKNIVRKCQRRLFG